MAQFTARAAAKRLNRNERTIRRWIHSGHLSASYVAYNRFAIEESEITRIQHQQGRATQGDLERRIARLEEEIARLSEQLTAGTPARSVKRTGTKNNARPTRSPRTTNEILLTEADLPPGSRRASEFAEAHGVKAKTARYHLLIGLGGECIKHLAIGKPGRPGEIERWLSPGQQEQALAFWARHGISFN